VSLENRKKEREPRLLDGVAPMIGSEWLAATPGEKGMSIDVRGFLAQHIDPTV
jgi:hypothetical protein